MNNFIKRTLTGIVFVAVLLGAICYHPYWFAGVFALITGAALWEFYGLISNKDKHSWPHRILPMLGGVYLFLASFAYVNQMCSGNLFLPYLLYLLFVFIGELYYKAENPIQNCAVILLGQLYCAGSFALLNWIMFSGSVQGEISFNSLLVLSLFIFVWANDTGAFLVGCTFGKHRLFERVSPKKSWEGFWGGLFFVMVASQVFAWVDPSISRYNWLGLSIVVVLFATWGDLTESLFKRTLGVKDSGKILPGHGGILDRFDSMMMVVPAAYIYIRLFIQS